MSEAKLATVFTRDGFVELRNQHWLLRVSIDGWLNPGYLLDVARNVPLADEVYAYDLKLAPKGQSGFTGGRELMSGSAGDLVSANRVRFRDWTATDLPVGGKEVHFTGRFDFGLLGPTDIEIEHVFRLPDLDTWFEEQIWLRHRFGRDTHEVQNIRFGFRKMIFSRDSQAWLHDADRQYIVPVPHRRRWGQIVDHQATSYTMNDIVPGKWSGDQLPGRGAEAWIWTDGARGYLIAKYNREQIEFSLADGEFVLAPSKRSEDYYQTFNPQIAGGANVCFRYAGVGRYNLTPEGVREIGPNARFEFGATRIYPVEGDWQDGYTTYKGFLLEKGHICPPDFDPPLHWNELYNLGWRGGDNAPLQERPNLFAEAAVAQDIGAEAFYLDPVWDVVEGSSIWDEERLGPLDGFVCTMRDRFGLKTSLHLMMHTKTLDEDPRIYRRRQDGSIDIWPGLYSGGRICGASPAWQQMKIEHLLKLAAAGVTFMMFDFVSYVPPEVPIKRLEPSGSACWDLDHGHEVPLTMQRHAEGILKVIQAIKSHFPKVLIEAHDRVTGGMQDFHPLYFQHSLPDSFDENWGFEYMWDPFMDLLSGKALSLYEYNLAYDIPLYLHIHCGQDNDRMLAFWWYASTCRHLGIGGVKDPESLLYQALKQAVTTYRRLKPFFTRGRFIGVEPLVHGHALPEQGEAVFILFNLGSTPITRRVDIAASEVGVTAIHSMHNAEVRLEAGLLSFSVEVPALSPLLVEVNTG
ncbi:MAG: hypothetical protein J5I90_20935 [Caldilineales bacterium]|nr:hypothetical protein [Caldilineales bacterium]